MKKFYYILILALCFSACNGPSNQVKIKGEIKGLAYDTLFLYGNDELSDLIDTIPVVDGKISHNISVDTLLHVMLILNNNLEYPLYLDKGKTITINGDLSQNTLLDIKGVTPNEEFTTFSRDIQGLSVHPNDTAIANRAEIFIKTHQVSLVSIYLLDKYFVQKAEPDLKKIKELISYMDGTLQDKPYIEKLTKVLEEAEKAEPGKAALSFSLPNAKGENINRTKFRNAYLLINFWASWCDSCKTSNAELRKVYKKFKEYTRFEMLGISLDMNRQDWEEAIKADTLAWEQVCDFMGWDNPTINQYGANAIPYNILLGTDGRILEKDIKGEKLINKLEELLKDTEKRKSDKKKK